jgi:hypothetical protein
MAAPLGFKTFATGDVLTAADTNGYLMQGVWTFADATARDAAVTSPQEGNVCYLKDTDAVQFYSGSAWTAVAGASGGMTLLSTTTLSGSAVTISSINQTHKNLFVQITGATFSVAGNCTLKINAVTDSFWAGGVEADNITPVLRVYGGNTALTIFKDTQTSGSHVMSFTITNYTEATYHNIQGQYTNVAAAFEGGFYGGGWSPIAGGAAVSDLVISTTAGVFNAGTVKIYGVS